MIQGTIGLIVGIIMGLTGAGGAMVSIPLFMGLLDTSLKEATVLSLAAVVLGTAANLIGNISGINKKTVAAFVVVGSITNYLSLPLKSQAPDVLITALLTALGVYSIWSVWSENSSSGENKKARRTIVKALLAGAFLGLITTLTGLGGGVVLVPILIRFFGKSYEEALPTSLAIILVVSLTSFIFQAEVARGLITIIEFIQIGAGALVAYFLLEWMLRKLGDQKKLRLRRTVFTAVTIYSVITVIIETM